MWYKVQSELSIGSLSFNFLPSWWNKGYQVAFGRQFVFDPDYRTETLRFMERTVAQRFPGLGIGTVDAPARTSLPDFGNAVTPALAGCAVSYPADNYPWNEHLAPEALESLRVPEPIEESHPYSEIVRQAAYLSAKLGQPCAPWLPPRGVQNDAVLIQGTDFLADLLTEPQRARKLLEYSAGVIRSVIDCNTRLFNRPDRVCLCNCTAVMASPALYAEHVQSLERAIWDLTAARGREFGIHHCGVADAYLSLYRRFPCVDFLEIGWGSDVAGALAAFPEATVQYIFLPTALLSLSVVSVRQEVRRLVAAAGQERRRFCISVPDIEHGTADEKLYAILEECRQQGGMSA
jgi:hypothetical protein